MVEKNSLRCYSLIGTAVLALVLTGCSSGPATPVAEAPTARATASATPTPTPTVEAAPVEAAPQPEVPAVSWASIDGTWCSSAFTTDCVTIAGQVDQTYGLPIAFVADHAGCFLGSEDMANVLFCPANVPTPGGDFSPTLGEVGRDNAAFDRIWVYNGQGPDTYFRQDQIVGALG